MITSKVARVNPQVPELDRRVSDVMSFFNRFINGLFETLFSGLELYSKIFFDIGRLLGVPVPDLLQEDPIDKRLNRLDEARTALSETLSAIEDLRDEIEKSKREHQGMLNELTNTLNSKKSAEAKLANLQDLLKADQDTLREIAAPRASIRQHTIGFILGVLASLVAATIWFFVPILWSAFIAWRGI